MNNLKESVKEIILGVSLLSILCWYQPLVAQPYRRSAVLDDAISFHEAKVNEVIIRYARAGDVEKPGLIFIHGTPGGWQAFEMYLESDQLQRDFLLVSLDRPGWGRSVLARSKIDGDFSLQADAVVAIMDQFPDKKWIVIGHSLGASIAPKVALHAPTRVKGLLLLAGSIDPDLGRPRWFNWAASLMLLKYLIPRALNNSNKEIMALSKQLEDMTKQIQKTKLRAKVIAIQGMRDKLVSPKNPRYIKQQWADHFASIKLIELPDAGHFIPWQQSPLVVQSIAELAQSFLTHPTSEANN